LIFGSAGASACACRRACSASVATAGAVRQGDYGQGHRFIILLQDIRRNEGIQRLLRFAQALEQNPSTPEQGELILRSAQQRRLTGVRGACIRVSFAL
jgi:hypothetical protein